MFVPPARPVPVRFNVTEELDHVPWRFIVNPIVRPRLT
jgi:hypothetical protein